MHDRFCKLIEALGISQAEVARRLAIAPSAITKMKKGENPVTERTIRSLVTEFNVNRFWLETGEGDMFLQGDGFTLSVLDDLVMGDNKTAKALLSALANLTDDEWQVIDKLMDDIEKGRAGD